MKKLLALVLALVMTLSLCTVSNAAYSDAKDVDYDEAVAVMSAVGVFQGADGKFSPKAELTREQAAKLIAYLDLGEATAEALPAIKVFNDVEANRWSAKYVAYCADAGYLAGVGDNNFDPAGKLTGYAFGKMLLCVLGYDAVIEGYTGANWTIAVAKQMSADGYKLAADVDLAPSATLTREAAAQYCLNALQMTMVKYTDKGTSIKINGAEITTGAKAAESAGKTLMKNLYGTKLVKSGTKIDSFGRPANTWTYKSEDVGTFGTKAAAFTFTSAMTEKELFAAIGAAGIQGTYDKMIVMDKIYRDGAEVASVAYTDAKHYTVSGEAAYADTAIITKTSKSNIAGMGNGIVCEIYADADNAGHYTMVLSNQFLGKISKVTKADDKTGAKRYVTVSSKDFETEDFAKNDYVIYTMANGKIKTMQAAEVVTGDLTKIANSKVYTIGGAEYKLHDNTTVALSDTNLGKSVSVYVDANGYIIGLKEAEATYEYLYLLAAKKATQDYITSGNYVGDFYAVLADGTVVNGKYEKDSETAPTADIYSYEIDATSGNYTLTAVTTNKVSGTGFAKNATTIGSKVANSATKFVFIETKSATNNTVKEVVVKEGIANLGAGTTKAFVGAAKDGVVKVVFVCDAFSAGTVSTDDLVYVDASTKDTSVEKTSDGTKTVYSYDAYKADGTKLTVTSKSVNISSDAVYVLNDDNTITDTKTTKTGTVKAINGNTVTVTISATDYNYTCDVDAVFVDVDASELEEGQTVVMVMNKDNTNAVDAIWVNAVSAS